MDINRDGKMDSLHFTLEMPVDPKENIYSVKLYLLFDIKLHVSPFLNLKIVINYFWAMARR
jgi:hypothetical protein